MLAFVDDDAVVDQGWLEALPAAGTRRRPRSPDRRADPAALRRSRRRPGSRTEIRPALTLLDRGAEVRDLDPHVEEAVYGANVSFRVGPLRRGRAASTRHSGHRGGSVFFAEENEAQLALARLGFRVRYVPDAGVCT